MARGSKILKKAIRRLRASGLTWQEVADYYGGSRASAYLIATGKWEPKNERAEEIMQTLPQYIWEAGKELEGRVWHIIRHRLGPENAIRQGEVAQKIGVPDTREVRLLTLSLLKQGFPVGTTTHRPYGIYRMTQEEHKEAYIGQLLGRVSGTLYRVKLVEALDLGNDNAKQLEMELQGEMFA